MAMHMRLLVTGGQWGAVGRNTKVDLATNSFFISASSKRKNSLPTAGSQLTHYSVLQAGAGSTESISGLDLGWRREARLCSS